MGATEVVAMFQFLKDGPIVGTDTRVRPHFEKKVDEHRLIYPDEPIPIFDAVSTAQSVPGNVDNRSYADMPAACGVGRPVSTNPAGSTHHAYGNADDRLTGGCGWSGLPPGLPGNRYHSRDGGNP